MKKIATIIFIIVILFAVFSFQGDTNFYENSGKSKSLGELLLPGIFKSEAKILFVGDMMFDRYIRQVGEKKGEDFIFSCGNLSDFLQSFDLVVGNLEGPITRNLSVSMGSVIESPENYTFTFPPSTAKLLAKNNIKLVNLGNNHMLNLSRDGLLQTKKYLAEAKVTYFGDPDAVENDKVARMEIGGVPISFVNWSDWNSDNTDITAAQIKKEKESGRTVLVYTHWGEEYTAPPERVKRLARSFIDAGADLIVGSHPHIVQEKEIYPSNPSGQANKYIYYSLGNFIFDQYWNKEVSTGLALEVNIKGEDLSVIEHKVSLNRDGRTCLEN